VLHIVGGVYREYCMHPLWREIFGSGGRAASAILGIGGQATLHSYLESKDFKVLQSRAAFEGFNLNITQVEKEVSFAYQHGLSTPIIQAPLEKYAPLRVCENKVIRYGMIEGSGIVEADFAVYDPQNVCSPESFHDNGSSAKHLALVLNRYEASTMIGLTKAAPEEMVVEIAKQSNAEVVVIKMGAAGALVYDAGVVSYVPAFKTERVWKLGSGDSFVAFFGYFWMEAGLSAIEAAAVASKATAYYCATKGFPTPKRLAEFSPHAIRSSDKFRSGYQPMVYLAGPFFTLAELWIVEQARTNLREMGLNVFSPYHDVGHGSAEDVVELDLKAIKECDVVFAIGDGLDAGTIYEVGYARSIDKPVIFYSENESDEDKKMMLGSGCILCTDYVTAIYKTLWVASEL
jgi:hypothetical protein